MNNRYFYCRTCKKYTDAGYRWAYWLLEDPGVVSLGEKVDPDSVLAKADFWNPPERERSDWLCKTILPTVKAFLEKHREHELIYVDEDFIYMEEENKKI